MADKFWKRVERTIAGLWGGRRVPVTGRQRGETPDIEHPRLSIEIKARHTPMPKYLTDAIDQAIQSVTSPDQCPIVRIHVAGTPYDEDLVLTTARYFDKHFLPQIIDL